MANKQEHTHRVSGTSGRTVGSMYRGKKKGLGHETRKLRSKNQLQPTGPARWKPGFADGGYVQSFAPHIEEFMKTVPYGHGAAYVAPEKK